MVNFLYNFLINGKIVLGDKPHACKNKYHNNQEYIARSAPTNISGFFFNHIIALFGRKRSKYIKSSKLDKEFDRRMIIVKNKPTFLMARM